MKESLKIGSKSKIHIHWKVSPYDYTRDKEASIIAQASSKYNIPKDRIKIIPEFIVLNKKGEEISIANEVVHNIQKPDFQLKLFKKYLSINDIKDCDFNRIIDIDSQINAQINYDVYDKYKRYKLKWLKWKNFLAYGDEENFFDFTNLNGLVLLNGEPANQSGKTTFAIDLTHFLFFGQIERYKTQDKIFNKHLNSATEVVVEGCIEIDGSDYIIKRRLTRPSLSRRSEKSKTTQKVEYFKIVNDELYPLEEFIDNQQEENSIQTNKVIKEAIGNESDFDMIVCATGDNLDDLIKKKDTERGRLLSRWIGLLPIEQKELIAREKFNREIKPWLLGNKYSKDDLQRQIDTYNLNINNLKSTIETYKEKLNSIAEEIKVLEENQQTLYQSKTQIDNNLLKIDITTLNNTITNITNNGKEKRNELESIKTTLESLNGVDFSIEDFNTLQEKKSKLVEELAMCKAKCHELQRLLKDLKTSEYCPTCGRKYENIDNSSKIEENTINLNKEIENGKKLKEELDNVEKSIENLKVLQEKYLEKCKLITKKSAIEVSIEQLRSQYQESIKTLDEYNKNNEAIDRNNQLDIQININSATLKSKRNENDVLIENIVKFQHEIESYETCIKEREDLIKQLEEEVIVVRNWQIYLDMIGKNGISKMVLRQVIPVINAQMSSLLNEVCDFNVEMDITDKNDVIFYLVKDGVKSELLGGSGFERTAAALALRSVLGNISTLPRMSCLVLDEVWGRVAKENYDNLRKLLEEIGKSFDFILIISHLDEVKDYCNTVITVTKKDNVSTIQTTSNVVAK